MLATPNPHVPMRHSLRVSIVVAWLTFGLGGCFPPAEQNKQAPLADTAVTFDYGWRKVAECSARQLNGWYQSHPDVLGLNSTRVDLHRYDSANYAEILTSIPAPSYGGCNGCRRIVDFIDVRDGAPGKAVATIHAEGTNLSLIENTLTKCQQEPPE
jgi:hypothetical protein